MHMTQFLTSDCRVLKRTNYVLQADFFIDHRVGEITMYGGGAEGKYCFADFYSPEQAKRAMEDLNRTPLLGRVVDIQIAQASPRMDETEKDHPLPVKPTAKLFSERVRR